MIKGFWYLVFRRDDEVLIVCVPCVTSRDGGPQHSDYYHENSTLCDQWGWSVNGALSISIHDQVVENVCVVLIQGRLWL